MQHQKVHEHTSLLVEQVVTNHGHPFESDASVTTSCRGSTLDTCEGCKRDWANCRADAHTLVFVACLTVSCSLTTLAQARADALGWRQNPWVSRLCFLYYPIVIGLSCVKFLGRSTLRTLACGGHSWADPVREDESALEFQIRAFWIVPSTSWFTIVVFASCVEAAYVALREPLQLSFWNVKLSDARMYTGAGTRAVIAVSFIAGSVTLLHAMRRRDTLLLRTCVLGNAAFAFSMLVMIVVAYAALPDRDELLDTTCSFTYQQLDTTCVWAYVTLLFSVMAVIVFLWYALVCMMLWRDYTQEESRLKPGVGDNGDAPGGWEQVCKQVGALLLVLLICILVTALNVASIISDSEGYFENIG